MLNDNIIIEGMEEPREFKSKYEMEAVLDFTEALFFIENIKIYNYKKNGVKTALGEVLSLLYANCHLLMQKKLAIDKEYQSMSMKDGATIYQPISKISN